MIGAGGIHERVTGQFPLSISTSLALEGVTNIYPDRPPASSMPLLKYNELWINLRTLYRNFMGALPKGLAESITVAEILKGMLEEMETIPSILKEYTHRPFNVVYYFSNYKDLANKYKHATLRLDTTPKQILDTRMLNAVMDVMLKYHKDKFKLFDLKLTGNLDLKTLIITHYCYDLLSYKTFGSLTLLESHTGKLKDRVLWSSKYLNGNQLSQIPFREDFIQVFGDSELFKPFGIKMRQELIDIAETRNWSSITTTDRIRQNIEDMKDKFNLAILKQIIVQD